MIFGRRRYPRYVARDLGWAGPFGVKTGVVDDTRPDEPSVLTKEDRDYAGFKYVTTLSNAKRIARKANRLERKAAR